jgi:predicted PurR-regulated permease PerM
VSEPATERDRGRMPGWLPDAVQLSARKLFLVLVGAAFTVLIVRWLAHELTTVITILAMSAFLSFALEPAVSWLAKRGWKRGLATGLIMFVLFLVVIALIALISPAVIAGFRQLVDEAPSLVDRLAAWLRTFRITFSTQSLIDELRANADRVVSTGQNVARTFLLGIAGTILGALFKLGAVVLFTFYFVAEGPRLRRAILSRMRPERQEHVLFVWEQAIEQTGGYFYSRLLLALINGAGMYLTLRLNNVPFAAPLAIFEGIVSEFIPIIGTYIGGAAPILVAFLTSTPAGVWALGYVIVYQQIENYLLSPRLTAKTMSLHPAVAFAAALIGGAIGGLLFAFLALPVAGVIQAAVTNWSKTYEVVDPEEVGATVEVALEDEPVDEEEKTAAAKAAEEVRRKRSEGSDDT